MSLIHFIEEIFFQLCYILTDDEVRECENNIQALIIFRWFFPYDPNLDFHKITLLTPSKLWAIHAYSNTCTFFCKNFILFGGNQIIVLLGLIFAIAGQPLTFLSIPHQFLKMIEAFLYFIRSSGWNFAFYYNWMSEW